MKAITFLCLSDSSRATFKPSGSCAFRFVSNYGTVCDGVVTFSFSLSERLTASEDGANDGVGKFLSPAYIRLYTSWAVSPAGSSWSSSSCTKSAYESAMGGRTMIGGPEDSWGIDCAMLIMSDIIWSIIRLCIMLSICPSVIGSSELMLTSLNPGPWWTSLRMWCPSLSRYSST